MRKLSALETKQTCGGVLGQYTISALPRENEAGGVIINASNITGNCKMYCGLRASSEKLINFKMYMQRAMCDIGDSITVICNGGGVSLHRVNTSNAWTPFY